jgi:hypothetical protein
MFVDRLSALLAETGTDCFAWAMLDNHFLCEAPHKKCNVKLPIM